MLGNDNSEQAVLHGSGDVILVNSAWKCERSGEFSDAAFRDPELGLRVLWLSGLPLLGDLSGTLSTIILNGSLVGLVAVCTLDGTLSRSTLDEASWWCARGVATLSVALDGQGMSISELDLDILLLDSGKFAVKFVGILDLLDVKLWSEGLQGSASALLNALVAIEVVEHTKEWLEGEGWVGGKESSWEERHPALWCYWLE